MSNEAQIEFWNGEAGNQWVAAQEQLDRVLAPITVPLLQAAGAGPQDRVVDVGSGCGETSLQIAPACRDVLGVDVSQPMVAHATARAKSAGLGNVTFEVADAAVHPFDRAPDVVISRFGVMFFDDPVGAFTHLNQAIAPDGRVAFVCWQAPQLNPWISVAAQAVAPFVPPPPPAEPHAPGPFAFADDAYVAQILGDAGFDDVEVAPESAPLTVGESVAQAVDFQRKVGPLSRALESLDEAEQGRALDACAQALEPFATAEGVVLNSATWIVRARKGAS